MNVDSANRNPANIEKQHKYNMIGIKSSMSTFGLPCATQYNVTERVLQNQQQVRDRESKCITNHVRNMRLSRPTRPSRPTHSSLSLPKSRGLSCTAIRSRRNDRKPACARCIPAVRLYGNATAVRLKKK